MSLSLFLQVLSGLGCAPRHFFKGTVDGIDYTARIAIPDYDQHLARHYPQKSNERKVPIEFCHFGVIIEFSNRLEISIHDENRRLDQNFRILLDRFGPTLLRNVHLPECSRVSEQRNVFPNLRFHIDRGPMQDDQYSLFWRDPFDPVQRAPRSSSTLILSKAAAHLQAFEEGYLGYESRHSYPLFEKTDIDPLIGKFIFELPWRAADGIGEVALLDNRTVLHASYYPNPANKGYPISVRYLF